MCIHTPSPPLIHACTLNYISLNRVKVSTKDAVVYLEGLLEQGLGGKVDLLFTDPPWGTNKEGRTKNILASDVLYAGDVAKIAELTSKLLSDTGKH